MWHTFRQRIEIEKTPCICRGYPGRKNTQFSNSRTDQSHAQRDQPFGLFYWILGQPGHVACVLGATARLGEDFEWLSRACQAGWYKFFVLKNKSDCWRKLRKSKIFGYSFLKSALVHIFQLYILTLKIYLQVIEYFNAKQYLNDRKNEAKCFLSADDEIDNGEVWIPKIKTPSFIFHLKTFHPNNSQPYIYFLFKRNLSNRNLRVNS